MKAFCLVFAFLFAGFALPVMAQGEILTYIHPYTGAEVRCRQDYRTGVCVTISERDSNYRRDRDRNDYEDRYDRPQRRQKRYLERVVDSESGNSVYRENRRRVRQRIDYGLNDSYYRRGPWFRHTITLDDESIVIQTNDRDWRPQVYRDSSGYYYYDY